MTALTIWLCGAVPLALFMLCHERPRGAGDWIGLVLITGFWPLFLLWVWMDR